MQAVMVLINTHGHYKAEHTRCSRGNRPGKTRQQLMHLNDSGFLVHCAGGAMRCRIFGRGAGVCDVADGPGSTGDAQLNEQENAQQMIAGPVLIKFANEHVTHTCNRALADW